MLSRSALLATLVLLTGCSPYVPVADLKGAPVEKLQAAQRVRVWSTPQLVGKDYEVVSMVEGHSCQHLLTDAPATRNAAVDQLKFYAQEAGADGLSNVQCGGREGTSLRTNCWELISCTAEAIKVN